MPFTPPEDRLKTDITGPEKRGDYCFQHYRRMLRAWRAETRWTIADELAANLYPDPEHRAEFLAYLVFFIKHVMPYEHLQCTKNGEIDY